MMRLNNFPDLWRNTAEDVMCGISQLFALCTEMGGYSSLDYLFNNGQNESAELRVFLLMLVLNLRTG